MTNLDFEQYFKDVDTKYYEPKYIITILENVLGNKLAAIRNEINNTQIVVSKEQIIEYLEKKFAEKNPELKKRIESPTPKSKENVIGWTRENVNISSQYIYDILSAKRYQFEPYSLEYFKRYSDIVRNKALLLLNIIEKIGNNDGTSIQDLLSEFDIQLAENGDILKEDIIRLIIPTVYNINALNEKVTKANDLSTYLTFKLSKDYLYRKDLSENAIYPMKALQIKNLSYDSIRGNVPLSKSQKVELEKLQQKSKKTLEKKLDN